MADPTTRTPLWVKVFGIIAIILALLFVLLHLTGNNPFSPGGHTPSGGAGGLPSGELRTNAPPIEHGAQQP